MVARMIFDAEKCVESQTRQQILKYVRPLYIMRPGEVYSPLGTGVLFHVGENYFLCSAAHVFDDFDLVQEDCGEGCELVTFGQGQTVILDDLGFRTPKGANDPKREKDLIDLAVMKLGSTNVQQIGPDRFLSLSQLDFEDAGSYSSLYCALAYPASKNKLEWRKSSDVITPSPLVYSLQKSSPEHFKKHELNSEQNLLFKFQRKRSKSTKGLRVFAPDPHGMSGGGLWRYRKYDILNAVDSQPPDFKLVGILIEWRIAPEGFLVTRVSKLRSFLLDNFPEIAGELH